MATDFPKSYLRAILAEDEAERDKAAALHRVVEVDVTVASVTAISEHRARRSQTGNNVDEEGWRSQAACRGVATELFFPGPDQPRRAAEARAVCEGCPVAVQCLEFAVRTDQRWGIWGETSERERRRLRRTRRGGAA